jgi:hypothetical protein
MEEHVTRFVGPALVIFPLLGGAAIAATIGKAPLMNQTEDQAIVKVEEGCGNGYFRDEYSNCRVWYGGEPAHRPHEGCPPDRHFVPWLKHEGGFCQLNY